MRSTSFSTLAQVKFDANRMLTSAVQAPEFEGWKKLSVDAIIFTKESSARQPATYVLVRETPFLPSGAARNS